MFYCFQTNQIKPSFMYYKYATVMLHIIQLHLTPSCKILNHAVSYKSNHSCLQHEAEIKLTSLGMRHFFYSRIATLHRGFDFTHLHTEPITDLFTDIIMEYVLTDKQRTRNYGKHAMNQFWRISDLAHTSSCTLNTGCVVLNLFCCCQLMFLFR